MSTAAEVPVTRDLELEGEDAVETLRSIGVRRLLRRSFERSVLLWFAFTGLLAAYVGASQDFGETYGPLAGVIGLLLWSFISALALFLGLAVAAQRGGPGHGARASGCRHRANRIHRARFRPS